MEFISASGFKICLYSIKEMFSMFKKKNTTVKAPAMSFANKMAANRRALSGTGSSSAVIQANANLAAQKVATNKAAEEAATAAAAAKVTANAAAVAASLARTKGALNFKITQMTQAGTKKNANQKAANAVKAAAATRAATAAAANKKAANNANVKAQISLGQYQNYAKQVANAQKLYNNEAGKKSNSVAPIVLANNNPVNATAAAAAAGRTRKNRKHRK